MQELYCGMPACINICIICRHQMKLDGHKICRCTLIRPDDSQYPVQSRSIHGECDPRALRMGKCCLCQKMLQTEHSDYGILAKRFGDWIEYRDCYYPLHHRICLEHIISLSKLPDFKHAVETTCHCPKCKATLLDCRCDRYLVYPRKPFSLEELLLEPLSSFQNSKQKE